MIPDPTHQVDFVGEARGRREQEEEELMRRLLRLALAPRPKRKNTALQNVFSTRRRGNARHK
jgi:hypothetical protein